MTANTSLPVTSPSQDRNHWLAALLTGVLLVFALLLAAWGLRACAPVEPTATIATRETPAPPAPEAPPDPTPLMKASLERDQADGEALQAELVALQGDIAKKVAACRPPEPPKPIEPPKPAEAPKPPPALPADRWAQKDLGLLDGCWKLGRDTKGSIGANGRSEACDIRAGEICFRGGGRGERKTTAVCPGTGTITCAAPITAKFGNDSTLSTTQPAARCSPTQTVWNGAPNGLTCRRVSDTLALCRDKLNF